MEDPIRSRLPELPSRRTLLLLAAGFFLATFAVYWASLSNKFVAWDDTYLIYFNPAVKRIAPETLKHIFTTFDPELYIPLTFLSYQLDYQLWGLNPFGYHLHSLVLHTCSSLLVAWLIYLLSGRRAAGVIAGLLFALHPLSVEAVSWASGRKDALSTAWMLGSFVLYLYWRERSDARGDEDGKPFPRRALYAASLAAFALSLMAKVMTLTLPVALLLLDLRDRRGPPAKVILEKLPYLALSVLFGVIGMFGKKQVAEASSLWEKIPMAFKSAAFYLQKLVAPTGLSVIYPYYGKITFLSPDFFVPALVVLGLLGLAGYAWLRRGRRDIAFWTAFSVLTLCPTFINIVKTGNVYFASDRYAYVPAIGIFAIVAVLAVQAVERAGGASRRRSAGYAVYGGSAAVLLCFAVMTHAQSLVWKNSETLFLHNLEHYPDAVGGAISLARIYRESGRTDEARTLLEDAAAAHPSTLAYVGLGEILKEQGRPDEAIAYYRKAEQLDPQSPEPVFGMAILEAGRKNYAEAERLYARTLELNPVFVSARNNLGALYLEQGKLEQAETEYRKAAELDPTFTDAQYNLGVLAERRGDLPAAIAAYERALTLDPDDPDTMLKLIPLYANGARADDAIALAARGLRSRPENAALQKAAFDAVKTVLRADPKHKAAQELFLWMQEEGIVQQKGA